MRVALARQYRTWMMALLPTTLGLGSLLLWLRTLAWPLTVDEAGITLRGRRRVGWGEITKIGVSRSYLDGHISQIRIHYGRRVSRVPTRFLRDGRGVAELILTSFQLSRRLRPTDALLEAPSASLNAHGKFYRLSQQQAGRMRHASARRAIG
jgi:hypothetical protein